MAASSLHRSVESHRRGLFISRYSAIQSIQVLRAKHMNRYEHNLKRVVLMKMVPYMIANIGPDTILPGIRVHTSNFGARRRFSRFLERRSLRDGSTPENVVVL